jgi:polyferredoxin
MDKKGSSVKRKWRIRHVVQLGFFVLITLIAINKFLVENGGGISFFSSASLHSICPFGGVVSIYNLMTVGTYVQKIHSSALVLMGLVFLLAVLLGPVFCGWVCPLGTFQEWIGKLGKKLFKKRYNHFVPKRLDKVMRYFRVFVMLWVIYITARTGRLVFSDVDPYYALFNFYTGEVAIQALVILAVTAIGSLFVERPWCKYLCPYGALLGFTNKFKFFKLKRNENMCISCNQCNQACPMNIDVESSKKVTQLQCISCFECTSENTCPIPETVNIKWGEM